MARKAVELHEGIFSCSICLEILKDPVTIPCGHSYCLSCLGACWDGQEKDPSCPQCRETFTPRPALVKNTMLAVLVEELKKSQGSSDDERYAQPGDVPCDVCIGRKLKAVKSCLQCLASYCDKHLQPHSDAAPLKKHKLVDPLKTLQDNACPEHNEVRKLFCRTDKQCVCHICCWDTHKKHNVVYVAAERSERQKEIDPSRQKIQQMLKDKSEEVVVLQKEIGAIQKSADDVVKQSDLIFSELVSLLEDRWHELEEEIRAEEKEKVDEVKALQNKLINSINKLQRRDDQLEKLSRTEDHNQFLDTYMSLPKMSEHKESFIVPERPLSYFKDMQSALTSLKDQVQKAVLDEWENTLAVIEQPDVLLMQHQPESREEFLKYARQITFHDLNISNLPIKLSEGNRAATVTSSSSYPLLSKERLTQRCYWEVEFTNGNPSVAVSYKDTPASSNTFGYNKNSWALTYVDEYTAYTTFSGYKLHHNSAETKVSDTKASKIGVYLDHRAGILSFYKIDSEKMSLIHKVQTTFTQPLYAGVMVSNTTARFCKLT